MGIQGKTGFRRLVALASAALVVGVGLLVSPAVAPSAEAATLARVIPSGFQAYQSYTNVTGASTWYMQRRTASGSWVNVSSAKPTASRELHFKLVVAKKSVLHPAPITYRQWAPANASYSEYVGQPFTIKYENPRAYTGVRKRYYDMVKSHCSDVTIRISGNQMTTPQGSESVAYYSAWYNQITVQPNLPKREQKTTLLHECAHHFQDVAYSKGHFGEEDRDKLVTQAAKGYSTSVALGLEYNADCVAKLWGGSYLAYGGPCKSKAQLQAARRIAAKQTIY